MSNLQGLDFLNDDSESNSLTIPISKIIVNEQIRKEFEDSDQTIRSLADSIEANGLLQPIIVSFDQQLNKYILIAGERRLKAHILLGREEISAIEIKGDDADIVQFVENNQRKNITPIEEIMAIKNLLKNHSNKGELAKKLGKSQSWLSKRITAGLLPLESIIKLKTNDINILHQLGVSYKTHEQSTLDLIDHIANNPTENLRSLIDSKIKQQSDNHHANVSISSDKAEQNNSDDEITIIIPKKDDNEFDENQDIDHLKTYIINKLQSDPKFIYNLFKVFQKLEGTKSSNEIIKEIMNAYRKIY